LNRREAVQNLTHSGDSHILLRNLHLD